MRARNTQGMHGAVLIQAQATGSPGGRREHAQRRAGVPALGNVLGPHANTDARSDFVARDRGSQKFRSTEIATIFSDRQQGRQHHCTHVQDALAVDIIEFKALHLGTVDQCSVGCGQAFTGAPDLGTAAVIDRREGFAQNPAPFELGPIKRAAQRIKNQELDTRLDLRRDLLRRQPGYETGNFTGVRVFSRGMAH